MPSPQPPPVVRRLPGAQGASVGILPGPDHPGLGDRPRRGRAGPRQITPRKFRVSRPSKLAGQVLRRGARRVYLPGAAVIVPGRCGPTPFRPGAPFRRR